jgi:primosomal protein N' (replication factor Y)
VIEPSEGVTREPRIVHVALDVPIDRLFDYRLGADMQAPAGTRVLVPFGARETVGVVFGSATASDTPPERLRDVRRVFADLPPLPEHWRALVSFTADYYQRGVGEVAHAALPPRLRRAAPLALEPDAYALTEAGRAAAVSLPGRQKHRRALLEALAGQPWRAAADLPLATPAARRALHDLVAAGWIMPHARESAPCDAHPAPRHALNAEQQAALDAITGATGTFAPFLLHGITGSGKTEVYLRAAEATVRAGGSVLVLVPEIHLTPALESAFGATFPGETLATLHSGVAETERAIRFAHALTGRARVVLGTRLAVFTPLADLALVIVDEEHDTSFKQSEGVRYSARDLAVWRARDAHCPVVLGSATPSLESWHNAQTGRYRLLSMPQRARPGAKLPPVRLVDLRTEPMEDGLAVPLLQAIDATLARGEQALVFINRRGYAPVLACGACGWAAGCTRCAAHLVVHLPERVLRCHHCGLVAPVPRACAVCGNVDVVPFGRGTQRVEAALAARFPAARLLRIDSDSTRAQGRFAELAEDVREGRADILVGTQILAKGHDFPRVTLVGVLNADAALVAADYRAPERLFAQLEQVAGRAGRADRPGEVLVQTRRPDHPLYLALARHDYTRFAATLLDERRSAGFPPFVHEAVLRADAPELTDAVELLREALRAAPPRDAHVMVYEPVPMTLARLAERARAHVLVQSRSRRTLQAFLTAWREQVGHLRRRHDVRWHFDVDPLEF